MSTPTRPRPAPLAAELTFVGRGLRHSRRNPDALVLVLALPVFVMVLFVHVFGTAIDTAGTRYVDYVVPGVILLCAGFGASSTAVGVCEDVLGGTVDRFRTLPVRSAAVLTGHVVASLCRNLVSTALVVGVALALGFRPDATPLEWAAAAGLVVLVVLALTWVSAAVGLVARSVEAASAFSFLVSFVPYVSSAFVPTDAMSPWLRWVADHQPATPVVDTLRGLLTGTAVGTAGWWAVAWSVGLLAAARVWAGWLFRRPPRA